jgi:hypothetical protein
MPSLTTTLTASTAGAGSAAINVDLPYNITDWLLRLDATLTENVAALLTVQDSVDNFATFHTLMAWNPQAGSGASNHVSAPSIRKYQLPLARIGVSGAKLRLHLDSIGGLALGSVVATLRLELNELVVEA